MEYKVCENCSEKLHVRTQRCPFCNTVLTDKSLIVKEQEEVIEEKKDNLVINSDEKKNDTDVFAEIPNDGEEILKPNLPDKDIKDYVYKAEVRHSLEYTKLMPNSLKVFITAISMIPVIGQIIGTFFGVFFLTYEDNDRKSFGKALISLSIIMFIIYSYNVAIFTELVKNEGLGNLLQGI